MKIINLKPFLTYYYLGLISLRNFCAINFIVVMILTAEGAKTVEIDKCKQELQKLQDQFLSNE